ncbi:hypothetical protein BGO17_01900 [Candidatus Saccharibacteria bacterium 49-20]|nr:MAG: hypothetical protein BGO17_01900 [Candidatus Saccharibacteria bacterium 49-20]
MNPQDQDQTTPTPEDSLAGVGTSPTLESPSVPQSTTPELDSEALQQIDALEAEPTNVGATVDSTPAQTTPVQSFDSPTAPESASVASTPPVNTAAPEPTVPIAAAVAGSQLEQPASPTAAAFPAEKKPSSKKGIIITLIVVLAIAAGVAGYFVYQTFTSSTASESSESTTLEEETGGDAPGGDDVPVESTVNP